MTETQKPTFSDKLEAFKDACAVPSDLEILKEQLCLESNRPLVQQLVGLKILNGATFEDAIKFTSLYADTLRSQVQKLRTPEKFEDNNLSDEEIKQYKDAVAKWNDLREDVTNAVTGLFNIERLDGQLSDPDATRKQSIEALVEASAKSDLSPEDTARIFSNHHIGIINMALEEAGLFTPELSNEVTPSPGMN